MIRLHGNLELALWETGNDLALYGHVIDDGNRLTGVALSYTYVKSRIINSLGEEYLDNSPLSNGTKGLQFWETQMWKEDDTFDVVLTYSVSPFCSMVGFDSFRMANRYYGHLWTGYQINREEEYVYITEAGEVYHTSADCTHLKLSIRQVDYQVAVTSTNRQGFRYQPCEKCSKSGAASRVYITSEGICYHFERDCSGLKRTVISVPLSGVKKYRLCQRCSQQKQKQNTD